MVVVAVMPFLPEVDPRRLRIRSGALLPGFLKPPLIAREVHDICGAPPRANTIVAAATVKNNFRDFFMTRPQRS